MIITNARKDDEGAWQFNLNMSDKEVDFLVNISVHSLIKLGIIHVNECGGDQTIDILKEQNAPASVMVN